MDQNRTWDSEPKRPKESARNSESSANMTSMSEQSDANSPVARILKMHQLTNAFRRVQRTTKVVGESRYENDSEHVYQLAMLAWYIIDCDQLPLDRLLVFEYCLAHDLSEVYAGDVDPWSSDEDQKRLKAQLETEAEHDLAQEFCEFKDLAPCFERYHARSDEESTFVYALDKIQPVINIYLDGGDFYRAHQVTFAAWIEHNKLKVAESKHVVPYFEAIVSFLGTEGGGLFYRP